MAQLRWPGSGAIQSPLLGRLIARSGPRQLRPGFAPCQRRSRTTPTRHSPRRRGIQYAAASRLDHHCLGILDAPPEPVIGRPRPDRVAEHDSMNARRILATRHARVLHNDVTLLTAEGAGKAGSSPPPWPACERKCTRRLPQVRPRHPGPPCAMVLTLIRALPGDRLSCPRRPRRSSLRQAWHQHRDARTTRFHVRAMPFVRM